MLVLGLLAAVIERLSRDWGIDLTELTTSERERETWDIDGSRDRRLRGKARRKARQGRT